jgi:hypothetical protein
VKWKLFWILVILLILGAIIFSPARRFDCFMKSDGSVYCHAADGHLFRLRFEKFIIEVP